MFSAHFYWLGIAFGLFGIFQLWSYGKVVAASKLSSTTGSTTRTEGGGVVEDDASSTSYPTVYSAGTAAVVQIEHSECALYFLCCVGIVSLLGSGYFLWYYFCTLAFLVREENKCGLGGNTLLDEDGAPGVDQESSSSTTAQGLFGAVRSSSSEPAIAAASDDVEEDPQEARRSRVSAGLGSRGAHSLVILNEKQESFLCWKTWEFTLVLVVYALFAALSFLVRFPLYLLHLLFLSPYLAVAIVQRRFVSKMEGEYKEVRKKTLKEESKRMKLSTDVEALQRGQRHCKRFLRHTIFIVVFFGGADLLQRKDFCGNYKKNELERSCWFLFPPLFAEDDGAVDKDMFFFRTEEVKSGDVHPTQHPRNASSTAEASFLEHEVEVVLERRKNNQNFHPGHHPLRGTRGHRRASRKATAVVVTAGGEVGAAADVEKQEDEETARGTGALQRAEHVVGTTTKDADTTSTSTEGTPLSKNADDAEQQEDEIEKGTDTTHAEDEKRSRTASAAAVAASKLQPSSSRTSTSNSFFKKAWNLFAKFLRVILFPHLTPLALAQLIFAFLLIDLARAANGVVSLIEFYEATNGFDRRLMKQVEEATGGISSTVAAGTSSGPPVARITGYTDNFLGYDRTGAVPKGVSVD
ncbi:unnamed protein product [Amoebophrya sp. A120]|nr:unnamed protein product [Amoebophrya sp. A120]|eukprot:GSA120T00021882001.1